MQHKRKTSRIPGRFSFMSVTSLYNWRLLFFLVFWSEDALE